MESRIERLCVEHGLKMTWRRRVIAKVSDSADRPDVEKPYWTVRLFREQRGRESQDHERLIESMAIRPGFAPAGDRLDRVGWHRPETAEAALLPR